MQRAAFNDHPTGRPRISRFRRLGLVAVVGLPVAFSAIAEEPKEKRVIRNVTPDSIPIIVLPPRGDTKPAPQDTAIPDERIKTTVQHDGTVHASGHRLVLAGVTPLPAETLCESPTHGRWACGVRAFVALRTLVHGKELRCDTPPEITDGTVARCYNASTDVSHWLLREGWALYDPAAADPLLEAAADEARKQGRGMWQNSSQPLTASR